MTATAKTGEEDKPRVGFIGLGIMGRPMAGQILRSGFPLTVFNRTASKTAELAALGASVADSPADVAARSEITITMVTDTPDVEQVVAGPGGILEAIRPGSIVVDMSTVSPALERRDGHEGSGACGALHEIERGRRVVPIMEAGGPCRPS